MALYYLPKLQLMGDRLQDSMHRELSTTTASKDVYITVINIIVTSGLTCFGVVSICKSRCGTKVGGIGCEYEIHNNEMTGCILVSSLQLKASARAVIIIIHYTIL